MLSRSFIPFVRSDLFFGVNAKDTSPNMLDGEWTEESINVYSNPTGALCSRPGFSQLTSASTGSSSAWTGFYQFDKHSGGSTTSYYVGGCSNGKLYNFIGTAYSELFSGLTTGLNYLWSFMTLDNTVVAVNGVDAPLSWGGTGSATTFATTCTGDFCLEWQRYGWIHSTADPRLMYYSVLGNPDSPYTTFLNFDMDMEKVTGACKQGDDMLVGKNTNLYRVQYRGSTPLFKIYKVPCKIGPVNFWTMKELPDGRVIFMGSDFNFYMASGDTVDSVGDNIFPFIKDGVAARMKYAVSGLNYAMQQYWCSFTYASGGTTNDRTVVMDWSSPYQDKWGNRQYPWFIYSIGASCFAEINLSGQTWLYHGGYVGKMYKNDSGTSDNGVAFVSSYVSKLFDFGDLTIEKKFKNINFSYANKGDWNLDISFMCDGNANTQAIVTQNMLGGQGAHSLWDKVKWDYFKWSSETDADISRDIDRTGKLIQVTMITDGLDEAFQIYYYTLHAKALRRVNRSREGS
jgi:hypothetical protein